MTQQKQQHIPLAPLKVSLTLQWFIHHMQMKILASISTVGFSKGEYFYELIAIHEDFTLKMFAKTLHH